MKFLMTIKYHIDGLELQRSRIYHPSSKDQNHDSDYYMILIRRVYREIENAASMDSRIANLKGKYKDLLAKIKIRDHFEHNVETKIPLGIEKAISLGLADADSIGKIYVKTCVVQKNDSFSIVSGNIEWDLSKDHPTFIEAAEKF